MAPVPPPLAFVLLLFSGWVNQNQQAVILVRGCDAASMPWSTGCGTAV